MKKGFTLIELAIVLVIIGLLISVGVSLLPGLINQQKYTQNQSLINKNYNTIIGYILANGKLPLAAINTNGTASTNNNIGYLPYQQLGALQKDAYGNTFYYALNNRSLNISINGLSAGSMSPTSTTNMQNFCAVLYALNYYYSHNPTLNASDIRTINVLKATPTPVVFVLISSGANNKLDSPNTITNSNGIFASEQYPLSATYDDNVISLSITDAIGKFCNVAANQFSVTYTNNIYQLTSLENTPSSNSTGNNTGNSAYEQCVSNCNQNWLCGLQAIFNGGCSAACNLNTSFCR